MDFDSSSRAAELRSELSDFMGAHVLPAESAYASQVAKSGDPHHVPEVLGELQASLRIKRRGDEYVLNGKKWWITRAADRRSRVAFVTTFGFTGRESHCER